MDSEQHVPSLQDTRIHRTCPQPQSSGPWAGGSSCGLYGPPQPTSLFDAYVRIAALEKELEHSRIEKATTEVTVRHLASICAKGPLEGRNGDEQLSTLVGELASVKEDIQLLKAKAENTHIILTALFPPGRQSLSKHKYQQQSASGEVIDLIDLGDLNNESAYVRSSPDDTTLLDTSNDDVDDHTQQPMHDNHSESSAFSDASYIHHFVSKDPRAPPIINGAINSSIMVPILIMTVCVFADISSQSCMISYNLRTSLRYVNQIPMGSLMKRQAHRFIPILPLTLSPLLIPNRLL